MDLKDSKTRENLMRAFAGESQARNRYDIASSVAKKEGLYVIEAVFKYTANQEKAHAKVFFDMLRASTGENINIEGSYPVEIYDKTLEHLKHAEHNELEEWGDVYKNFSEVAKGEGFQAIATAFSNIATIEKNHADRFSKYATDLGNGTLFTKQTEIQWICTNCGFIYEGKDAPTNCPACFHPKGYFMEVQGQLL